MKAYRFIPSQMVPQQEYDHAVRLLAGNPLDIQILEALIGRPRRYSELQPLLKGKSDVVLNRALDRLLEADLVDRVTQGGAPPIHTYELTPMGAHALFALTRLREPHRLDAYARAYYEARSRVADTA
ncbi:MAG TPA: winged helix-turn-helix transcriptional regulator [Candidatus Thermoplasmatota archaeon]